MVYCDFLKPWFHYSKRPYRGFTFLLILAPFVCLAASSERLSGISEQLAGLSANERIILLEHHLYYLDPSLKTPAGIEESIEQFKRFADSAGDAVLGERVAFIQRIRPVYTEESPSKRVRIYEKAHDFYNKTDNPLYSAICQHYIGQNQFLLGVYGFAFENLLKAHRSFLKIGLKNIPEIGLYMHNLALDHFFFKEYHQAIELMEASLDYPAFGTNLDIQRFNTLACAYRAIEDPQKEKLYFEKTYEKAVFHQDSTWMGIALGNLGAASFRKGAVAEAMHHFQRSLDLLSKNEKYPVLTKQMLLNIAEAHIALEEYSDAWRSISLAGEISYENQIDYFGDRQENETFLRRYHDVLRQFYIGTQNFKVAYQHLDTLSRLVQKHHQIYNQDQVKAVNDHLKIQEQQAHLQIESQKNQLLMFRLWLAVFSAILLLLAITLLFYRKKLKDEKEKLALLSRHRSLEIKQKKTHGQLLQARVKLKEYIERIQEKATNPSRTTPFVSDTEPIDPTAITIERLKQTRILTKNDWEEFQALFYEAFPDFTKETQRKYCELTPSELRYLMLEQIGLTAQEMGQMLGISFDSTRVTRHRLRKKRTDREKDR